MQFYQCMIIYYIAINLIAFALYGIDKFKAKNSRWRIPERSLIALAVIGGGIGALLGMIIWHHKTRKIKFRIWVPVALFIHILLIILVTYNNNHLVVTTYDVDASVDCRIVQVSDLHNTYMWFDKDYIPDVVAKQNPDIIVITGDIIDGRRTDVDAALYTAGKLSDIAPTYYVTGNHEYMAEDSLPELLDGLKDRGVAILNNDYDIVSCNDSEFVLIGLDDKNPVMPETTYPEEMTTVLLNHRPIINSGFDVILSGHEHGGQFNIPGIGPFVTASIKFFPDKSSVMGMNTNGDSTLIISRGVGNSIIPVRINNYPEIVVVNLHKY